MNDVNHEIAAGKALDRAEILTILQVALQAGEERFVRNLAEDWLNAFPYDLPVEFLRARALLQEGKTKKSLLVLKRLTNLDPEYREAQELQAHIARRVMPEMAETARAAAVVLSSPKAVPNDIEDWAQQLIRAQLALAKEDLSGAEAQVQSAMMSQPPNPLPALMHLHIVREQGLSWLAVHNLLDLYSEQWPKCLQLQLLQAEQLIESGEEDEAVEILHRCVAEDVTGQVARRLWGERHRFSALWPQQLNRAISIPIPASVAAGLGWNHLASGERIDSEPIGIEMEDPEPPESGTLYPQTKTSKAAAQSNGASLFDSPPETPLDLDKITTQTEEDLHLRADGRFPSYVVLTTKKGLKTRYGLSGLEEIDTAMRSVVKATAAHPNWDACLIYADDENSVGKYGLSPAKANDPWGIKLLLVDLDHALRSKGEMIGSLLIVGGPEVVPMHHLPNPVDDDDKDVPSDNPYASADENYFVPSWPIGRLPGGEDNDPTMLIKALQRIAASRESQKKGSLPGVSAISRLLSLFGLAKSQRKSFGYSAEIWRRASHSVYRTIGEPRKLSISPPIESGQLPKAASNPLELAYFNLHGLEATPDWYGQRDPLETPSGPDYPVAISPKDIVNSGRAPQVVFTEACFGANVIGKTVETAMALKFLDSGSKAVVGSTCTSYGSVTTPLIAADLLGQTFWKLLNEGHPVGEALRRAKIALAHAMHRRQGYLDGEDQKTLISFVLYGDPLARANAQGSVPKRIMRPESGSPQIKAVCDKAEHVMNAPQDIPAETLATVKSVVQEYLPGMQESRITMSHEHLDCKGHDCPIPHPTAKSVPGLAPNRQLVTLCKQVHAADQAHSSYARITMDQNGKVVKLAVSR